jgi:hypothetical protein
MAATLALAGLWSSAQAVPLYYTFEGNIDSSYSRGGTSYFADAGLTVGSAVSYTLLVDFDQQGSHTHYNGITHTYTDHYYYDHFLTDYIAGSALMDDSLGPFSRPHHTAEYNDGYQRWNWGRLFTGSDNSWLNIYTGQPAFTLDVGDTLRFDERLRTNNSYYYGYEHINGNLSLASISEHYDNAAAIPEPGTFALMGLGLVGMCLRRRFTDAATPSLIRLT